MKYYEDKSDRKMELKLLSLSEDDKLIRECMEQASAFYGCLGKMGVTEILCDRKKAQELGADCQITGIFTGGELTAFACAFEYTGLKRNGRKWLNPGDKEWRQIETLGTNVVVIPLLVGKEKVGRLIELLREQYRDSHLLFRISGEQSEKFQEDLAVVSEKNLKSHRYDAAGENVWLFHFAPQIRMEDTYFEEEILLILPGQEVLLEMGIEEAEVTMVKLTGYEIVRSEKGSAFFRKPGAACEGVLLQCDYEQLLRYQRFINLTNYEEHFEQTDRGKALIYSEKYQSDSSLLWNDLLREMVKTRKAEWSIVPDSYIMYPVTYKEQDRLLECACYDNQEIGNYMHYMDIRLQCETGVPFGKDGIDLMERYKNRLERIPLGRLRVRITLEMILDILDHEDQPVGCDAEAEAVLSIDRLSHIGVLTLVSLSTPFLLSHFLDNIVRNQLMVIEENGEAVNLYAYMQEKWGLNASGTPKSYEMIPKEKNCLNKKQLGAVLLSETIYEEGEDFGEFTDAEILKLTNSETGMFATETGQADVTINVSAEIDGDGYGKAETVSVNIKDDKNIVDYLKRYWKHIVISLLLLILILGYVPPFKKRFARSIKKRPSIECSAEKIGLRDNVMKGNFEKDLASRLLPYVPETGRLTFSPTPVKKTAKVRASGGGSMLILNTSAFAGKEEITFNGMSIQENEKGHHRISASTIIVVSTPEFTYTCIPNVQRTANGEIKRGKRK